MMQNAHEDTQYTLRQILAIWAIVALPMAGLAWVVTPALIPHFNVHPGIVYWLMMIVGMAWQFVVALSILYRELGTLRWSAIRRRTWLNTPRDPEKGKAQPRLWWWLVPFIFLNGVFQLVPVQDLVTSIFPFLSELSATYDMGALVSPELKATFKGAWWLLGLFLISSVFNYFLGEEFLFRGVLLPRMSGVFGKWDWFANGVLFGCYHLHKPWVIPGAALLSGMVFSYPSRRFRSNWFAVIVHGGEGLFVMFIILGIILGLV